MITDLIRSEIKQLSAYHVPVADGLIKLDAMENPYSWPEDVVVKWLEVIKTAEVNRYPDPAARNLLPLLRKVMQVPDEAAVVLGNGSDELIQTLLLAVAREDRVVMVPEPSFVMYQMITKFVSMQYVSIPLQQDFSLDQEKLLQSIEEHQPAVLFLAYPNNPTGNLFKRSDIEEVLSVSKGIVVVDEAYHAFSKDSFMRDIPEYDNLLVMRTTSKLGLAGLRLGLLAGNSALLAEIEKIRLPYNINSLTQITAEFIFSDDIYPLLEQQAKQICSDREKMLQDLQQVDGIEPYPSQANFILFQVTSEYKLAADDLFAYLKERGVLIKNLSHVGGALGGCLRVTVGREDENKSFIELLR